jgi:hypothetical protein
VEFNHFRNFLNVTDPLNFTEATEAAMQTRVSHRSDITVGTLQ